MKLSELIAQVGDENVRFQTIISSFVRGTVKKNDAEITFATDIGNGSRIITAIASNSKPSTVGLILWLPRDKIPESLRDKL